jgi:Type VI secretion system/phage-baseplate injector OB domain
MVAFYGKYRGTVEDNVDPEGRGRVQVSVPAVFGDGRRNWAEPCVAYAGDGVGLFAVPPVKATVWVEFERGDRDYPILAGALWCGQAPSPGPAVKVWKTEAVTITLNDDPNSGGLTIEVGPPVANPPMRLAMTSAGIQLSIGSSSVSLTTQSVSVNDGALEVV